VLMTRLYRCADAELTLGGTRERESVLMIFRSLLCRCFRSTSDLHLLQRSGSEVMTEDRDDDM